MGKKKPKYKDIHGTTRIGDFLRSIKKSNLIGDAVDMVGELSTGNVLGALQTLLGKDEGLTQQDREHALELIKLDIEQEKGITKRWESDMKSDSLLSKNIRPMSLIFLTVCAMALIVADSMGIDFNVKENWINLLSTLLVSVYVAYFGSRGAEKVMGDRRPSEK
jgi:hypothetical protein